MKKVTFLIGSSILTFFTSTVNASSLSISDTKNTSPHIETKRTETPRPQINKDIAKPDMLSPPPNLFPSWLTDDFTPAYLATSYSDPIINNNEFLAYANDYMFEPSGKYFVSCNGKGNPLGSSPQSLVASQTGRYGNNFLVEYPCFAISQDVGGSCPPFISLPPTEQEVSTATANAYISVDAVQSYFAEKHDWHGISNDGQPMNVEFGKVISLGSTGWNHWTQSVTYCPGHIKHIDNYAHEFMHGIVEATANFQYNMSGTGGSQSRELNEAYADFFAEMVQFHANIPATSHNPNSAGDYIVVAGKNDPSASGNFFAPPQRPCASDPTGNGFANIYRNAGPIRHMMYLLAEGTDPENLPHSDVCQGPQVLEGIGRDAAATIWFDALVECDWNATGPIDHCDARRCTLEAASCPEKNDVRAAWNAVEMTATYCEAPPDSLCSEELEF